MAESLVAVAIQIWKRLSPFKADFLEDIWRDRQLRATSINDSGIASVLSGFLHRLAAISHTLTLKSPSSKPVIEILEGLQALLASNDLGAIVSTEERIRSLVHLLGGDTEADHGVINDAVVLQGPQIVQLLLANILVRGKTKNAVRFVAEALRFVESEELEVGALVLFQVKLQLDEARLRLSIALQRLDARIILPNETLQLGRAVRKLGGGLRKNFA